MTRILVIDDEPDVTALIAMTLAHQGGEQDISEHHEAATALERIVADAPDVVLLDIAMPRLEGFDILERLRREGNEVPVILLTAKGNEQDKVRGLELGADDYVTKPFSTKELAARVDAVLRRYRASERVTRARPIEHDGLRVDFASRTVTREGETIRLTPTEYELLAQLVQQRGRVLDHRTLLARVWGPEYRDETHYLKVYVGRLRAKIEPDPARPRYIETVRGVGYRFPGAG